MNDLISVIIPVYNVEKYIFSSVKSILNQTYSNLQIILVDDGSTDKSGEMCDELEKMDSRISVIHKENGGVSSARNVGLKNATGKYVGFVDPDDLINKNMYERMHNVIVETDSDCILCNSKIIYSYDEVDIGRNELKPFETFDTIEALRKSFGTDNSIIAKVWDKLFKKKIIENILFDETLTNGEDTLFCFNAIRNCKKICALDEILYYYLMRNDSAIKKVDSKKAIQMYEVKKSIYDIALQYDDSEIEKNIEKSYAISLCDLFFKLDDLGNYRKELKKYYLKIILERSINFKTRMIFAIKALLI